MVGPASYSRDADVAAQARAKLDRTTKLVGSMDVAQRAVVASLVDMWPTSAWLAAGARSAKQWLIAYTGMSVLEARRLERIAGLCARDERLCAAVVGGALSLGRAEKLARAVTDERARFLAVAVAAFLGIDANDDDTFDAAVRHWRDLADQELAPQRVQDHSVTFTRRLFGGGEMHGSFAPGAFENILTAVDAFTQDPDPADAPDQRTLSERRADGTDDMATFALTHDVDDDLSEEDLEAEADRAEDTYDGSYPATPWTKPWTRTTKVSTSWNCSVSGSARPNVINAAVLAVVSGPGPG